MRILPQFPQTSPLTSSTLLQRSVTVVGVQFVAIGLSHCLSTYFAKRASFLPRSQLIRDQGSSTDAVLGRKQTKRYYGMLIVS